MEPINLTPAEKQRRKALAEAKRVQKDNLKKRLEIRLEKALENGNQDLSRQLFEEFKSLK